MKRRVATSHTWGESRDHNWRGLDYGCTTPLYSPPIPFSCSSSRSTISPCFSVSLSLNFLSLSLSISIHLYLYLFLSVLVLLFLEKITSTLIVLLRGLRTRTQRRHVSTWNLCLRNIDTCIPHIAKCSRLFLGTDHNIGRCVCVDWNSTETRKSNQTHLAQSSVFRIIREAHQRYILLRV